MRITLATDILCDLRCFGAENDNVAIWVQGDITGSGGYITSETGSIGNVFAGGTVEDAAGRLARALAHRLAAFSLVLWVGIVAAGRLIAYLDMRLE